MVRITESLLPCPWLASILYYRLLTHLILCKTLGLNYRTKSLFWKTQFLVSKGYLKSSMNQRILNKTKITDQLNSFQLANDNLTIYVLQQVSELNQKGHLILMHLEIHITMYMLIPYLEIEKLRLINLKTKIHSR